MKSLKLQTQILKNEPFMGLSQAQTQILKDVLKYDEYNKHINQIRLLNLLKEHQNLKPKK